MAAKIEIISREIVKPSSSNDNNHPKIYTFSFFDQMPSCIYMPLLFFYKSTKNGQIDDDDDNRSNLLKLSLSAALSRYYPLAGRVKDGVTLDCNDEGALFIEARIECGLSQLLNNNPQADHHQLLKLLFPYGVSLVDSFRTGPLAVQITYFRCGGMSLGIYMCHKMMDVASIASFIKDWASLARNSEEKINPPEFDIESLYPPLDLPFLKQNVKTSVPETTDFVSRRVVFDGSKIAKLKEMVADQVPNPTRVEVVSSLLFKSALSAKAKAISTSPGRIMSSFVNYTMNLRPRVSPPVSERKKGNLSSVFQVWAKEDQVDLGFLVKEFRKEKTRFSNSCANITNREDLCGLIMKNVNAMIDQNMNGAKHEMYVCNSWCRYPFYESDFGWGKPLRVAADFPNVAVLLDTREGDGIEAFISMEEKTMAVFEKDQELLSYCCVNPSVVLE